MVDTPGKRRRHRHVRREKRIPVTMPVRLANTGEGLTRDISASGIYLEMESEHVPGHNVDMTIDFTTPAGKLQFNCQGVIVRVEQSDGRVGIAVKISASQLRYGEN